MAEGQLWDRLMDIFRRKAGQGVEIKVLFDDFGSMMRMSEEAVEELRRIGAEVLIFNPVHHYVNRLYFNYRDHRKIACIDGDTAYTGGANIADEYANLMERFGYWKDDGIRLEGQGPGPLTREFIYMWERMGGAMHQEHDYYRPHGDAPGQGFVQPLCGRAGQQPGVLRRGRVFAADRRGQAHGVYHLPYLAIDESMEKALCMAAGSGVDVRLMMPGDPGPQIRLHGGGELFRGAAGPRGEDLSLHAGAAARKTVLADREAAFVGSVNMDYRSFQLHFECGTLLYGAPALETLLEDMDGIMEKVLAGDSVRLGAPPPAAPDAGGPAAALRHVDVILSKKRQAAFSRTTPRFVPHGPPQSSPSTRAPCKVFFAAYTPPQKRIAFDLPPAGGKRCEAFTTDSKETVFFRIRSLLMLYDSSLCSRRSVRDTVRAAAAARATVTAPPHHSTAR